jgi:hypothetical protein
VESEKWQSGYFGFTSWRLLAHRLEDFLVFFSFVSEFDWASHSERRSMID